MATSDKIIGNLTDSIAALGAPDDYLELFKVTMHSLLNIAVVEYILDSQAAEGAYKH